MNSKEANKALKKGLKKMFVYLLISIPLAFLLVKIIELKYTRMFWGFMAILGITGFLADWYDGEPEDKKNNFIKMVEHIAFISFITLLYQWCYFVWFAD